MRRATRAQHVRRLAGVACLLACAPSRPLPRIDGRAAPAAPVPATVRAALPTGNERWPTQPLIEHGADRVGAPAARLDLGATGEGATVCLVDTGVDLSLPGLRDAEDHTRVRWLLDLERAPRGTHAALETRFGAAVFEADELDALGAAAPGDWHGHGTAMAAVAVGDDAEPGAPSPGPRAGAAPAAALVVVRALRRGVPGFRDEDLIRGVEFCAAVAGLGAHPTAPDRTVLLLGAGGHDGGHDGTSPLERALEAQVAAGRPVVVSAGNDGGQAIHAGGVLEGEARTLPVFVPAPVGAPGPRSVALAVYVAEGSGTTVALVAPDGVGTGAVGPGRERCVDHSGGRLCVDARADPVAGARRVHAVVTGGGDVPAELSGGRYALELRGVGRVDVWIAASRLGVALGSPELSGPWADDARSVTSPASAAGVLAVGAAVQPSGDEVCAACAAPGSSRGPNRLGVPKPDLIAPGSMFVPLSRDLRPGDAENMFGGLSPERVTEVDGDGRALVKGSSFAAPWVAGALALAYSQAPAHAADADLLRATARDDGAAYTPAAGAGLLDVPAFLRARARDARPAVPGAVTYAWTAPGETLVVRLMDADGWPARGRVAISSNGVELLAREVDAGWTSLTPPSDAGPLRLTVDDHRVALVSPAPGCAVALAGRGVGAPAMLLVAGLALAGRRRWRGVSR